MNHANLHVSSRPPASRYKVYRILSSALLLAALALWLHWKIDFAELRQWLETLGPLAPILFVCVGVILMSVCIPKTFMSISAGALFGTWFGSGVMLILAVTAALLNYHIGRWLIHQPLAKNDEQDITNAQFVVRSMAEMAADAGFKSHLLVRLTPVPTMVISYAMGSCRARQKPYLAAAAFAVIPQILWVHSGTAAVLSNDTNATAAQWISIMIAILGGTLVAILVPREAMRRIRENQATP